MRRALVLSVLAACLTPTQIHLTLTSDVCDRIDFARGVKIYVATADAIDDESIPERASATTCKDGRIGDLYLVPSPRKERLGIRIVADVDERSPCTGADGYKGCIVARRIATFISHESLELPVHLEASCIGVPCSPTTTCVKGQCVDARVERLDAGVVVDASTPEAGSSHTVDWMSAGGASTCMRISTGDVYCWGANTVGQLAIQGGATTTPTPSPLLKGYRAVSLGVAHSCGIDANGAPRCWGSNSMGQLGDGTTTLRTTPGPIAGNPSSVIDLRVGVGHSCTIDANTLYCWGANGASELGLGMPGPPETKPRLTLNTAMKALSVGAHHTCAIASFGVVYCWGANSDGRTGAAPSMQTNAPSSVAAGPNVRLVGAGATHSCFVDADVVSCFGSNADGQLGSSPGPPTEKPQPVSLAQNPILMLTAGDSFSCVLMGPQPATAVWCWGRGANGQLGDGMKAMRPKAVSPMLPQGILGITSGRAHTCAWTKTSAWCWGDNTQGQIGDGKVMTDALAPVSIAIP